MANRFWEQDGPGDAESVNNDAAREAGELKTLLSSIVGQLADADRRHTAALNQMQDRLTAMSEEAKTLKSRAPEHFSSAFDRIEAGMAELSAKIAETAETSPAVPNLKEAPSMPAPAPPVHDASRMQEVPARSAPQPASTFDHPVALRSAADYAPANFNRHHADVDTFDVIESSMPGDDAELWDQDAADALASVYGTGLQDMPQSKAQVPAHSTTRVNAPTPADTSSLAAMSGSLEPSLDTGWLETRFSELTHQLEKSLSGMQSGRGQAELCQRIDAVERNISGLLETVATRTDVEGVRLIEAHVGELVEHLDNAQRQLHRLDSIETQVADLAAKMDEVRSAVLNGGAAHNSSPDDIDLLVNKAAGAAAQRFAANMHQVGSGEGETRALIERLLIESRQGEENTVALLDTLQQAMIRLLDRVDAMELAQHRGTENRSEAQQTASQNDTSQPASFGRRAERDREPHSTSMSETKVSQSTMRDSSTAANQGRSEVEHGHDAVVLNRPNSDMDNQQVPRTTEKLRQDFIADARRAKMRLSSNGGDAPDIAIDQSDELEEAPTRTSRGNVKPAAIDMANVAQSTKTRSGISIPKVIVLGIATLLATVAVAWYVMGLGNPFDSASNVVIKEMGLPSEVPTKKPAIDKGPTKNKKEARTETQPQASEGEAAQPANEAGVENDEAAPKINLHQDIRGEIVPGDMTIGATEIPLYGVAVDTANAASLSDIQKAKRQQAMAMASSKIGQAASGALSATQAALNPNDVALDDARVGKGLTSVTKNTIGHSSPLDLPPAVVGPLSLRLAAANGDPSAQFQVGSRLAEGKGNEQNFAEAAKWYQRAASAGFAQAQYRLGTLYERGLGVKTDAGKASDWYTKSADLGNVKAMHNLAVMSANQRGSSPDYETAAKWFTQAADRGLSDSQFNLAVLHENGLGVPQDLKTAYKWLAIAARGGDGEAVRRRDILKGKLTTDDLAAAEGLAKTWKAKQVDPMINDARTAGEAWKKNPANGVSG